LYIENKGKIVTNSIIQVKDLTGTVCAIIIKNEAKFESLQFLTDSSDEFQLGIMKRGPGSPVLKHRHNFVPRSINKTSEFLSIRTGFASITIWSQKNEYIDKYDLAEGDCILLTDGFHEIEFNSECQMLEIKQGPYYAKLDKSYEA
jgi:hypothetical protein